jgi:REP element-mobilizing transposase RayT
MAAPVPIYSAENCSAAYQLNWAVSLFGNLPLPRFEAWAESVCLLLETDGVRILRHRAPSPKVWEFFISTKPDVSPARLLQVLKGRAQHAMRADVPKAFRRNYRLESVGSAKRDVIERYVAGQIERHPMADQRAVARLTETQITRSDIDLSELRYSAHGQFRYNLHVVLEHEDGWSMTGEEFLRRTRTTIHGVCAKKGFRLSQAGIVADHLHLAIGCEIESSPLEVALSFLNNLAYSHGQRPIYKHGFYVGTFGNFDLGALRQAGKTEA